MKKCNDIEYLDNNTDNDLTDDGAKFVADALKVNTRVWHLNLECENEKENTEKRVGLLQT